MLALRPLVAFVLAAGVLGACAESRRPPDFMGNTNWLHPCDGDAECGSGLQCSCGLCTRECQRQAECGDLADAVCDSSSDAFLLACGHAEIGLCLAQCAQPGDCAAGQLCVDSRCLPEEVATRAGAPGPCEAGSCPEDAGFDARAVDLPDSSLPPLGDADVLPDADAMPPDAEIPTAGAGGSDAAPDSTVPNPPDPDPSAVVCGAGFVCEIGHETQGAIKHLALTQSNDLYAADWGTSDALGNHNGDGSLLHLYDRGPTDVVRDHLDRPWRVWPAGDQLYWLGGDSGDFGVGSGPQTLYHLWYATGAESEAIRTDAFAHVHVRDDVAYWLANGGLRLNTIAREGGVWSAVGGRDLDQAVERIAGVDASYVYFETGNNTGGLVRMSRSGMALDTVAIASSIFLTTVGSDAFWFIHTDNENRDWVSFAPKSGGAPTHVADADGYFDPPQPGSSVVWFITAEQTTDTWQLWAAPKTGGEREPAFRFPTERGLIREDAPSPVWLAVDDHAWVFTRGKLIRIQLE